MPVQVPEKVSLEALLDYEWRAEATLLADDRTKALASPWTTIVEETKRARDVRDVSKQKTARAEARQRLFDVSFDGELNIISGVTFLAAGKNADADPYVSSFGTVKADEAKNYGSHKAALFGSDLVKTQTALGHPSVVPLLKSFGEVTVKLEGAGEERAAAAQDEQLHDVARKQLIARVERLAAETEIALLKIHFGKPHAKALVSATVGWPRPAEKRAPAPKPAATA